MSRRGLNQTSRLFLRGGQSRIANRLSFPLLPPTAQSTSTQLPSPFKCFSTTQYWCKGIMPDTEYPTKQTERTEATFAVAELSDGEYHELADSYLDKVLGKFEQLQDEREDIDIEYSAGVMTINVANKGTYVVNKQPPNKQIWLSSPISGPKRYDWCVVGEGQADKEGTASGYWIYARDSTILDDVFLQELNVDLGTNVPE